ncbi:MAG: YcfA family protein [Ignavibacteria bacterium]|nr:YcfA family protein [Ignavibacteria bacterium]
MSKLPEIKYKDLIKKAKAAGFQFDRQAKGSHEIWYNSEKKLRATIPNHPGTIKKGTLGAIIKQLGLTTEELSNL